MGLPVTAAATPQPPAAPTASAASVGAAAAMAAAAPLDVPAALPPTRAASVTYPAAGLPPSSPFPADPSPRGPLSAAAGELPLLDPTALATALAHTQHPLRTSLFSLFRTHPAFRLVSGGSTAAARARTAARIDAVAAAGALTGTLTVSGSAGRSRLDAVSECLASVDYSAAIGLGVHAGLFASAVAGLGSAAQAATWAPRIEGMAPEWRGCFALTELGHGSDARGVETTAVWVRHAPGGGDGGGYILDTPGEAAQKYWIGGAAAVARWAVVFAQLYTPPVGEGNVTGSSLPALVTGRGVHRGIHAFLVRIRTNRGAVVPTVTTADCGAKGGLNGVDNGRLWFDATPLPADALLCRHATVSPTGVYTCDLPGEDAVFATAMAALTGGRAGIAASAAAGARVAAAIAVRYGLRRRAFVPPASAAAALTDGGDGAVAPVAPSAAVRLIDWPGWRLRVVPVVAWTVVYGLATAAVKEMGYAAADGASGQGGAAAWGGLHTLTSAVKAGVTEGVVAGFQTVREALGGQGFKAENRVVCMRADWDVALTFEGDNYGMWGGHWGACGRLLRACQRVRRGLVFEAMPLEHTGRRAACRLSDMTIFFALRWPVGLSLSELAAIATLLFPFTPAHSPLSAGCESVRRGLLTRHPQRHLPPPLGAPQHPIPPPATPPTPPCHGRVCAMGADRPRRRPACPPWPAGGGHGRHCHH